MKKRNKYFFQEKEYLRLKTEYSEAINNYYYRGWIDLEIPEHNGYLLKLALRDDISRREDAWEFQYIIDNFTTNVFSKTKDFNPRRSKKYRRKNILSVKSLPGFKDIKKNVYESLSPKLQKHFVYYKNDRWSGDLYMCILPQFYFVNVIEKNYVTKVKLFDDQAMKDLKNIESTLNHHFYKEWQGYSPKKWVRKHLNGVRRHKTKSLLKNHYDNEHLSFDDNYKDAKWF